jgi:hypothetical protein
MKKVGWLARGRVGSGCGEAFDIAVAGKERPYLAAVPAQHDTNKPSAMAQIKPLPSRRSVHVQGQLFWYLFARGGSS